MKEKSQSLGYVCEVQTNGNSTNEKQKNKKQLKFHYTGCLIGMFIIIPIYITYNWVAFDPIYAANNQCFGHCSHTLQGTDTYHTWGPLDRGIFFVPSNASLVQYTASTGTQGA